jgi:Protein of unknown function (DUF2695)
MPIHQGRRTLAISLEVLLAVSLVALSACSRWQGDADPNDPLERKELTQVMTHDELAAAIKSQLVAAEFPETQVKVETWKEDPSRTAVYFTSESFANLYPEQRAHWVVQALPNDFLQQHLSGSLWFELAPGERPEDLLYPDAEVIEEIEPDVLKILQDIGYFTALDDAMAPQNASVQREECRGDFRITKRLLAARGLKQEGEVDMVFDACHVLMHKGAYCDCEVLYKVYPESRLGTKTWQKAHEELKKTEQ